jgi:hypothetical protein
MGFQGDCTSDLEAEGWRGLSLDSVMADFIHMGAAIDADSAEAEVMVTEGSGRGRRAHRRLVHLPALNFKSGFYLNRPENSLSAEFYQEAERYSPVFYPLLCPRRTFLAFPILASKFTQDRCYLSKAWAKLSGLLTLPRGIGRCEQVLGDALERRLWVGKSPASCPVPSSASSRVVIRSGRDGGSFTTSGQGETNASVHYRPDTRCGIRKVQI